MAPSRRTLLRAAALSALAPAAAAGCASGGGKGVLRLATGGPGGPYEALGARLAAELRGHGFAVRVIPTAASVANLTLLAEGRADLGFALADSAEDAVRARRLPVAALARLYMNYVHLIVRADSQVTAPADLAGRTVSIGGEGSGTAVTAERILAVAATGRGARRPHIVRRGLHESLGALRRGEIEAFFWSGGVPTPALEAFRRVTPIRLIALDELVGPLRRAHGPMYEEASVPARSYGLAARVLTVGTPSYLVCRDAMGTEDVRSVTRILFSSRERLQAPDAPGGRLDERYAIGTGSVPLHPGAARYYRSVYG
ncbi:TAXI family TRAP transporter solute-binding subunit [Actinomadura vinacea]|uniref:TAXI family TRAP transporter solute-binding subunit n=1 Tax=Actinomadura vinacea TaxID=115336 RepID=A0ABN3IFI3_9ACTN